MGTRSLTHFWKAIPDWNDETQEADFTKMESMQYATIYIQYDGYPEGVGVQIAEFILSGKVVNGIGLAEETRQFNGFGCFLAQYIAAHKSGAGNLYMEPPKPKGHEDGWQEYEYTVTFSTSDNMGGGTWSISILENYNGGKVIFEGTPEELLEKYKDPS